MTEPDGEVEVAMPKTDNNGRASFAYLTTQPGTYTFTVLSVRDASRTYDPAQNVETSDSVTIP